MVAAVVVDSARRKSESILLGVMMLEPSCVGEQASSSWVSDSNWPPEAGAPARVRQLILRLALRRRGVVKGAIQSAAWRRRRDGVGGWHRVVEMGDRNDLPRVLEEAAPQRMLKLAARRQEEHAIASGHHARLGVIVNPNAMHGDRFTVLHEFSTRGHGQVRLSGNLLDHGVALLRGGGAEVAGLCVVAAYGLLLFGEARVREEGALQRGRCEQLRERIEVQCMRGDDTAALVGTCRTTQDTTLCHFVYFGDDCELAARSEDGQPFAAAIHGAFDGEQAVAVGGGAPSAAGV